MFLENFIFHLWTKFNLLNLATCFVDRSHLKCKLLQNNTTNYELSKIYKKNTLYNKHELNLMLHSPRFLTRFTSTSNYLIQHAWMIFSLTQSTSRRPQNQSILLSYLLYLTTTYNWLQRLKMTPSIDRNFQPPKIQPIGTVPTGLQPHNILLNLS